MSASGRAALAGGGGATVVRKLATETVANSIAFQDDDELFVAIGANEVHVGEFILYYDADTGGDIKLDVTTPAGATIVLGGEGWGQGALNQPGDIARFTGRNASAIGVALGGMGAAVTAIARVPYTVVNGANAGQIRLQWAQAAASATATHVFVNSLLIDRLAA